MKVLIAGGAGYIGSTVASACLDAGIVPVILDSLVTGRREFTAGRAFYQGDISTGRWSTGSSPNTRISTPSFTARP